MKVINDEADSKDVKDGRDSSNSICSDNQQPRFNTSFHHVRFFIIILGGMACGAMFLSRLSITVAMLSMVNHTHLYLVEHPNNTVKDFVPVVQDGPFIWSNEIQQTIISGYMIAYTLPQVFTTRLTLKYGIRNMIPISLCLCAISCVLTPVMSFWGWRWTLGLRLVNGLGASAILPSMIGAIEKWVPYKNSAGGLSLLQFVQTFFYISTPLISGLMTDIHWKWVFHVPGITLFVFAVLWYILVRDDPDTCPFISQKEIDLIKGLGSAHNEDENDGKKQVEQKKPPRTDLPFYFMFKIKSFYFFALIWMLYCATFGGFLFLMPSYLYRVMKVSVVDTSIYVFIIQFGVLFSMLWPNPVISLFQKRYNMSLTTARGIVCFIYTFVSLITFSYIAAFHNNHGKLIFISVLCINRFFNMTNDTIITATLMSQFGKEGLSSVVYSMMNTIGNLASTLFCWAAGRYLDKTGESLGCWSGIFIAMNILNIFLFFIYALFLKSEPVEIPPMEKKNKDKETNSIA